MAAHGARGDSTTVHDAPSWVASLRFSKPLSKVESEKRVERATTEVLMDAASELCASEEQQSGHYGPGLHGLCRVLANSVGVHPTMVAPLVLGAVAGIAGHNATILVDPNTGWKEHFLTWPVGLAYSASGKSPAINLINNALRYIRDRSMRVSRALR